MLCIFNPMKHLLLMTLIIVPLLAIAQQESGKIRIEVAELKLRYDDIKGTTKSLLRSQEADVFKDYESDLGRLKRRIDNWYEKLDSLQKRDNTYILVSKKFLDSLQYLSDTLVYANKISNFAAKQNAVTFSTNCVASGYGLASWQADIGNAYKTTPVALKIFRQDGTEDAQSFYTLVYCLKGTPDEKNVINNIRSGDMKRIIIGDCLFFLKKGDTTIVDSQPENVIVSTKEIRFIISLGN
jgi:hypothetical protein